MINKSISGTILAIALSSPSSLVDFSRFCMSFDRFKFCSAIVRLMLLRNCVFAQLSDGKIYSKVEKIENIKKN
jgi:hypothetical protein